MTDEQINKKIAEACGWKRVPKVPGADLWFCPPKPGTKMRRIHSFCPDYCNDLNAMHEAEQQLSGFDEWMVYDKALAEIAEGFTWHATARQRAEAFLRTLSLWEE